MPSAIKRFKIAKPKWSQFLKRILMIGVYVSLFLSIQWWQQRDMLEDSVAAPLEQINLVSSTGEKVELILNANQKPTFIYFFAPWCRVCHYSIDNLEEVYQANNDDINIVAIALDWDTKTEVTQFLSQHKLSLPVLLGTRYIQQQFKINAYPSYYLISKDGLVSAKGKGYTTELGMKLQLLIN
ncbi:TlpA family protein disulfide reductase [Aliikangiella sp. IMCC44653]